MVPLMLKIRHAIIFLLLAMLATSVWADNDAEALFQQAQASYESDHYREAVEIIQKAVKLEPDNSNFQHFLGKCYGRLAEKSHFLSAMSFAEKTRKALEKAVQLDGHNVSALKDLMEYYRQAPGFLGGSKKKADKIEKLLQEMQISPG